MKALKTFSRGLVARRWMSAWVLMLLALAGFTLRAMDEKFETFRAGTQVFSNATVLNKTRTDIFVQHDGGMSNVKVKDVDPEILRALGYELPGDRVSTAERIQTQIMTNVTQKLDESPRLKALEEKWQTEVQPKLPPISRSSIIAALACLFLSYLLYCYCCMLIVKKTGNQPGLLVWIPVLQMIPIFRAAGMSGWWLLLSFVPVVGLIGGVMWCFKIVETRGKSAIWAVLLLLPLTNFIAFLYLALADSSSPKEADTRISLADAA